MPETRFLRENGFLKKIKKIGMPKMSRKAKIPTIKKITKSIRLLPLEAEELAKTLEGTAYTEAALLRQWVIKGLQQFKVSEALKAYQEGQISLRQAAERAGLPVAVLLEEMAAKKVAVIENPDAFGPGLSALRETFGK